MKLTFITREGYNLAGARIRCFNFANELRKYGLDAEVLSYADHFGARDGQNESAMGLIKRVKLNHLAFRNLIKDKDALLYVQRFNYHSFAPYLAHLLNKNRLILDLDDWEMRENQKYYFGFYPSSKAMYFTAQIAKRSAFCIAASRFLKEFLSQFNKRVYYIPSGVDTEVFRPSLNTLSDEKIVFMWIGTLNRKEYIANIKFILDCFQALKKKCSQISFEIVGDGIYRDDLTLLLREFNEPSIMWRKWIAPDNVPAYLNTVHIGLFPAVNDNKFNRAKSPTKLFEYMAMAKPTISSPIGEALHIVKEGVNGFLASTKDEFVDRMKILVEDSEARTQMGSRAREAVESRYSLRVLGRQLYEIFLMG